MNFGTFTDVFEYNINISENEKDKRPLGRLRPTPQRWLAGLDQPKPMRNGLDAGWDVVTAAHGA
jgi:hypothetical protein